MIYIKRIFTFIMFALGLVGLLIGASYIFLPKSNNKDSGMEEFKANGILGEKENSIDVIFIGDSETYSAFIPLQLWQDKGYTSYNCGTSGQTLDYTEVMIKRIFQKQSPKVIVLETHAIYRKFTVKNVLFTKFADYFSVLRYHNRWKTMDISEINQPVEYTFTDECKGYRFSTKKVPSTKGKTYMNVTKESAVIEEINRRAIERIKKICDENGAKLILVSTPSTKCWNYKRHNGMVSYAKEIQCEFYDLNLMPKEVPIDWANDTRDKGDHLNYFGAKKVTSFLSEYLENTALLTDKRGNPDYENWDKALAEFNKKLSEQKI